MKKSFAMGFAVLCMNLAGCSLCLLECARPIDYTLNGPDGAHWIKDGMSRESRRADIAACGAKGNESVNFLPAEIQAAIQPEDPNDINAYGRLYKKWALCMESKGYVRLEHCDGRCLYP